MAADYPDAPQLDRDAIFADPSHRRDLHRRDPARPRRPRRPRHAGGQGRDDRQAPAAPPSAQLEELQRTVERDRPHLLDLLHRAPLRALGDEGGSKLVADGAIGTVVQTVGLGPHRLQRPTRPSWFFEPEAVRRHHRRYRLASGRPVPGLYRLARKPRSRPASIGNFSHDRTCRISRISASSCCDRSGRRAIVRVDWLTPEALPTWGDGRLTILGTTGYIELRKYIDIAGRPGKDHLFLVNGRGDDAYRLLGRCRSTISPPSSPT